jgi:hypothetical protein
MHSVRYVGYVEKKMYFLRLKYQMFYVLYPFVTYLLTRSYFDGHKKNISIYKWGHAVA